MSNRSISELYRNVWWEGGSCDMCHGVFNTLSQNILTCALTLMSDVVFRTGCSACSARKNIQAVWQPHSAPRISFSTAINAITNAIWSNLQIKLNAQPQTTIAVVKRQNTSTSPQNWILCRISQGRRRQQTAGSNISDSVPESLWIWLQHSHFDWTAGILQILYRKTSMWLQPKHPILLCKDCLRASGTHKLQVGNPTYLTFLHSLFLFSVCRSDAKQMRPRSAPVFHWTNKQQSKHYNMLSPCEKAAVDWRCTKIYDETQSQPRSDAGGSLQIPLTKSARNAGSRKIRFLTENRFTMPKFMFSTKPK